MRSVRASSVLLFICILWQSGASPSAITTSTGSAPLATIDVPYTQNFDSLLSTPNGAMSTTLPDGWAIDEAGTSARNDGKYTVGTGSDTSGDIYAFGSAGSTDRTPGTLRSGTLVPIVGASFTNNTGQTITSADISYTGEQWRIGTATRAAADRLDFQIGVTATGVNTGTFADVDALDFLSPITNAAAAGALDGNAGANRHAVAGTILGLNIPNGSTFWIRWTDFDVSGADDGLGIDDFALTPHGGIPSANPTGTGAANPSSGVAGSLTLLTVTVTPGTNPVSSGLTVVSNLSAIGGSSTQSLFDDATNGDVTAGDSIFSFFATVAPGTSAGLKSLPVTISDAQTRTGATSIAFTVDQLATSIHDIQGAGAVSPLAGTSVTTQGVVTGVKFNGFFIQAPDLEADANTNTSEGIFVFTSSTPPATAVVGNRVRVSGTVSEFKSTSSDPTGLSSTELIAPAIALVSTGNPLPNPIVLTAADLFQGASFLQLEKYEGMRVHANSVISISPTDGSVDEANARSTSSGLFFGVLPGTPRPFREPGIQAPLPVPAEAPPGATPPIFDGDYERIGVDTFSVFLDPATAAVFPPPPGSTLEVTSGIAVNNITGPLDYSFRSYIVDAESWEMPSAAMPNYAYRPVSGAGYGEFSVATANMERFFDTTDDAGTSDVVLTPAAFDGRVRKASLAIRNVLKMPDIVGVEEMENLQALQAVADRVNADAIVAGLGNPDYHAFLFEGNDIGGIDSGLLVRGDRVDLTPGHFTITQYGKATTYTEPGGAAALLNDRPPLVLEASILNPPYDPYLVTVIVNHLRSLSGVDGTDGLRIRTKRRIQAEYLAQLIRGFQNQGKRVISIGDYNAFEVNDGYIDVVGIAKGAPAAANEVTQSTTLTPDQLPHPALIDLIGLAPADQRYSFMFDGIAQELDHLLVTTDLMVNRIDYGRMNADFPESYRGDTTRPERLSDHDPAVAYFNTAAIDTTAPVLTVPGDIAVEGTAPGGAVVTFIATARDGIDGAVTPACVPGSGSLFPLGSTQVTCTAMDAHGNTSTKSFNVTVVDTTAPSVTSVSVTPSTIWPPAGNMVRIDVNVVAQDAVSVPVSRIVSISGNDGATADDWAITGALSASVRAERTGAGDGRTYTVTVETTDTAGNTSISTVEVFIPHDRGKR